MRNICLLSLAVCSTLLAVQVAAADVATPPVRVLRAALSGAEEVPPVDTGARGRVVLLARVGSIEHRLIVSNAREIVAAHIHCGALGENGPVGVTLFEGGPVTVNGTLTHGPILAPDIGNGCGWRNVGDIVAAAVGGNAYVNVHTTAHPGGEIRGQLK